MSPDPEPYNRFLVAHPDRAMIHHVLEVYEESAKTYQRLIVDEIDRHGAPPTRRFALDLECSSLSHLAGQSTIL